MVGGRRGPCHPGNKINDSIFFFLVAFLFVFCFFAHKGPFLCFTFRKQKAKPCCSPNHMTKSLICTKEYSSPKCAHFDNSTSSLMPFYPVVCFFFHCFHLGFWDIFPKPWKNDSKKQQIIVVSKFSSWTECS